MPESPAAPVPRLAAPIELYVNGKRFVHEGDPAMPLLWFLRDTLRLTGARPGCVDGGCGACTVLVDQKARPACSLSMAEAAGSTVTTIEGLAGDDGLHPVQQAWMDEDAIGCGWCQPGMIMATVDLLARRPAASAADIDSLTNACRCGTWPRVRKAVQRAAARMKESG